MVRVWNFSTLMERVQVLRKVSSKIRSLMSTTNLVGTKELKSIFCWNYHEIKLFFSSVLTFKGNITQIKKIKLLLLLYEKRAPQTGILKYGWKTLWKFLHLMVIFSKYFSTILQNEQFVVLIFLIAEAAV